MSEEVQNNSVKSEQWSPEAEQNWAGFWDLIAKEYIRQNPEEYKKLKEKYNENIGNKYNANKT
jgi:hypothetical protein